MASIKAKKLQYGLKRKSYCLCILQECSIELMDFVAIDLETTGKYPLVDEICEVALIRFNEKGETLDTWSSLVFPSKGKMSKVAQQVHGISLEELKGEPTLRDLAKPIADFVKGSSLVGHNLQFDLGFLAYEIMEALQKGLSRKFSNLNFCTSLISLQSHPKLSSHRLAFLCEHFKIDTAPNHRAMQDAKACMEVFLKILEERGLEGLVKLQQKNLAFEDFIPKQRFRNEPCLLKLVGACERSDFVEIIYAKGSKKNKWRKLQPQGLVLKNSISESFFVASDPGESQSKRFMLSKIKNSRFTADS